MFEREKWSRRHYHLVPTTTIQMFRKEKGGYPLILWGECLVSLIPVGGMFEIPYWHQLAS